GVTPLFALIALHQAFLGRRIGLLLAFLACLVMHPTNLFLAPVIAAVYLGRTLPRVEPARRWKVLMEVGLGSAGILMVFGLMALKRSGSATYYAHPLYRPPHGPTFLVSYGRFLLGMPVYLGRPVPARWLSAYDVAFWGTVAPLLVFGGRALARQRR